MTNQQPIEKREPSYEGTLQVHSIFKTIQGEGPFCGTPCVFIRLAGCNLQCPACDTDYTSKRESLYVSEICARVQAEWYGGTGYKKHGLIVITGGEPFRQHIGDLIATLIHCGFYVQVESNGTMNPPLITPGMGAWNQDTGRREGAYLVISPKTGKLNPLAWEAACALKYVIAYNGAGLDGLPNHALDHPAKPARPPEWWDRPIYIQPLDSKNVVDNDMHTSEAVASCLKHGYILQLQIHKLIGVE